MAASYPSLRAILTQNRTVRYSSWPSSAPGATMPSQLSPCAFWRRPMSKPITCFRYCTYFNIPSLNASDSCSAELEMTVNMLIQIDKLVQLLESPVFTCWFHPLPNVCLFANICRSPPPAIGAGKVSTSVQVSLRTPDAPTAICCFRSPQESA